MDNLRTYGDKPFKIALIHGGPGARGEMAPVAQVLCKSSGILEPLQSAHTIQGQLDELKTVLETEGQLPVILVGHSWGAWLSFILAAKNHGLVKKLVLVSSPPFEPKYAEQVRHARWSRLSEDHKQEFLSLAYRLDDPDAPDKDQLLARYGELAASIDLVDPLLPDSPPLVCDYKAYQGVWAEAEQLRASGELLKLGKLIKCPVLAIHGDYDTHPADGVKLPLTRILRDFSFILLEKCGHSPWREKQARDRFYEILKREISSD